MKDSKLINLVFLPFSQSESTWLNMKSTVSLEHSPPLANGSFWGAGDRRRGRQTVTAVVDREKRQPLPTRLNTIKTAAQASGYLKMHIDFGKKKKK